MGIFEEINKSVENALQREQARYDNMTPPETEDIDLSEVSNIKFDGIDYNDYPDFCDAYIFSADYKGVPMSKEELEALNEDRAFVYESLMDYLH